MHRIAYFLKAALRGLTSNPLVSAISIVTITVSLLTLGTFYLVYLNLRATAASWGGEVQIVTYLAEGLPADEVNRLSDEISRMPGVSAVKYVSRDDALERFRKDLGGQSGILDGLSSNPLPASLDIQIRERSRAAPQVREMAGQIASLRGVDDVQYGQEWLDQYQTAVNFIRIAGAMLGAFLLIGSILVVANTIKLALYSRREELEILSLVGASKSFVRIPFLIEGLAQGVLGAALAGGILYGGYRLLVDRMSESLVLNLGHFDPVFLPLPMILSLLGIGAAVGLFGSALSVRHFGRP
ncbi:MAG: permease-like cell division protein FtsX [Deltaproteobacteria bacterium]|nr:permease-like cell division protein FtsX [Deltaproteobacteria bacterium]